MTLEVTQKAGSIADITVNHGPPAILGRFFLAAETDALTRGIKITFASFEELARVNEVNRATWSPILPLFNPKYGAVAQSDEFCMIGRNEKGEAVATTAARLFHWPTTNYYEEATSLRMFYSDPDKMRQPGERHEIADDTTKAISGNVVFGGAAWFRSDYRKRGLLEIMPRIARAYAVTHWWPDRYVGTMGEKLVSKGADNNIGYPNLSLSVTLTNSIMGSGRFAFFNMRSEQIITDLADYLSRTETLVDLARGRRTH